MAKVALHTTACPLSAGFALCHSVFSFPPLLPVFSGFNSLLYEHLNLASCPLDSLALPSPRGLALVHVSSGLAARAEVLSGLGSLLLPVPVFPHTLGL